MIATWLKAIRVKHWIKNFFVLAPCLASYQFGFNVYLVKSVAGFFLFNACLSRQRAKSDDRCSDALFPVGWYQLLLENVQAAIGSALVFVRDFSHPGHF